MKSISSFNTSIRLIKFLVLVVFTFLINGRTYGQTSYDISLATTNLGTPMDLAYDPVNKLYYVFSGGWPSAGINVFDSNNDRVHSGSVNVDQRSGWYNENTNRIEVRSYNGGWYYLPTDANGVSNANGVLISSPSESMGYQEQPDYADHADEIIVSTSETNIKVYDYSTGSFKRNITITKPSGANFNQLTIYSNSNTQLIGKYDYTNKRLYWFPYSGGASVKFNQLPNDVPSMSFYWDLGWANDRLWFFSNGTVYGYPMDTTGEIGNNQSTLSFPYNPSLIQSLSLATKDGSSNGISYQWEISSDNINFTPIDGAISTTFDPEEIQSDTYYRRKATFDADQSIIGYSNVDYARKFEITKDLVDEEFCNGTTSITLSLTTSIDEDTTYQ